MTRILARGRSDGAGGLEVVPIVVELWRRQSRVSWLHSEGGGELLHRDVASAVEVVLDRDGEVREPAVALDFPEAALGFDHPGGGPSQAHLSGGPVLDVAVDDPDGRDHRL